MCLSFGSKIFLTSQATSEWGNSGSNGGEVTVTLNNQEIEGDIIVDKISSLELIMTNSKFTGTINSAKSASKLAITLDSSSTITLPRAYIVRDIRAPVDHHTIQNRNSVPAEIPATQSLPLPSD